MLEQLLGCPSHPERKNYQYLPVSTSYQQELRAISEKLFNEAKKQQIKQSPSNEFIANETTENIQNELVLLKLKGYIDQRDITAKNTEIKKLPSKVQVGTVIEGEPIVASKIRLRKQEKSFTDYFLKLDEEKKFTQKKFTELQRINQRKRKLKRKIIAKKQKQKGANK